MKSKDWQQIETLFHRALECDVDGGNLRQLTDDGGVMASITADNKWVVYFKLTATGG
jgi:hypothetical protein